MRRRTRAAPSPAAPDSPCPDRSGIIHARPATAQGAHAGPSPVTAHILAWRSPQPSWHQARALGLVSEVLGLVIYMTHISLSFEEMI